MFVENVITLACFLITPTIHHFIGPVDDCTMTKVCNHTWTPLCAHNEVDSSYRLFLDDCDLHEYNCDNNKTYTQTDFMNCGQNCTRHDVETTTPSTSTTTSEKPSSESLTATTVDATESTTTSTTTTTTTTTPSTTVSSTTASSTTASSTTASSITASSTTASSTTASSTTASSTTASSTTASSTTASSTTTSSTTTLSTTTPTTLSTESTPITPKNDSDNTIPSKRNCSPENCTLPSTWETTSEGETRDFVQILNERFGKRVKILRNTPHFAKTPVYVRQSDNFIPGRYSEM